MKKIWSYASIFGPIHRESDNPGITECGLDFRKNFEYVRGEITCHYCKTGLRNPGRAKK